MQLIVINMLQLVVLPRHAQPPRNLTLLLERRAEDAHEELHRDGQGGGGVVESDD